MQLQYYVKREKCKVNDVIFSSGCEARAFNLGNKNMKIGIFTGGTNVRSENILTDISRYPTGKHEIRHFTSIQLNKLNLQADWKNLFYAISNILFWENISLSNTVDSRSDCSL